ncbi:MAG: UpxY family transcription antiterminator [Odoribacter sp.]
MMEEQEKHWHAVFTASRAEKKVRERLREEGVECFLPVQTVVRQWTYRKSRVEVPVIAGMIFVRVTKVERVKVLETKGVVMFLRLRGENGPAVIPDKQMREFRFLLDFSEEAVEVTNEKVAVGDLVIVVKGALKGLEGELVRLGGDTKVVVRMEMLGCAMVKIPASFVERMLKIEV